MFFVISGFVITSTLVKRLSSDGAFSLAAFYRRRALRLLPALGAMIVTVSFAAMLANPIASQRVAAWTGVSASVFAANAYLYLQGSGYFQTAVSLDPFLHLWTLAVEEQFYLVFPALLILAVAIGRPGWSRIRNSAIVLVSLVTVLSFTGSLLLSRGSLIAAAHRPQELAFYSSPSRAWEFGVGALLALTPGARLGGRWAREFLGALGLATILLGATEIKNTTAFPGTAALIPVVGTAAVIFAGNGSTGIVFRTLGGRFPVRLGDRSYSLYLWHWPLIVFAAALWPGSARAAIIVAATLSIVPAAASYRWVENPIRSHHRMRGRRLAALVAICVAAPILTSLALFGANRLVKHSSAGEVWAAAQLTHADDQNGCQGSTPLGADTPAACTWHVAHSRGDIVLIGDSNSSHFSEAVIRAGRRAGFDVTIATFWGCPFIDLRFQGTFAGDSRCRHFDTTYFGHNPQDPTKSRHYVCANRELCRWTYRHRSRHRRIYSHAETGTAGLDTGTELDVARARFSPNTDSDC